MKEGEDATFVCTVKHSEEQNVTWMNMETMEILGINQRTISNNSRIFVQSNNQKKFILHIYSVQKTDQGEYKCMINTTTSLYQVGKLNIMFSPEIIHSTRDIKIDIGDSVSLLCLGKGNPEPQITWRREDNKLINHRIIDSKGKLHCVESKIVNGLIIYLEHVTANHMATYLCYANNSILPIVSNRIVVDVRFLPKVFTILSSIQTVLGQPVEIKCYVYAYPHPASSWVYRNTNVRKTDKNYSISVENPNPHYFTMILRIRNVTVKHLGNYRCKSTNYAGTSGRQILLFQIPEMHRVTTTQKTVLNGKSENETTHLRNTASLNANISNINELLITIIILQILKYVSVTK